MSNICFRIFGVPDGFDIYQPLVNTEEKKYFLCFYDEMVKEDVKFIIHRRADGCVTYNYLRYHLFSNGSRPNSFIGLSVVFEQTYYADVVSLFNLLGKAYEKLLNNGIILQRLANSQNVKFSISHFNEKVDELKTIETFVIGHLQSDEYAVDIKPIEQTFSQNCSSDTARVPFTDVTTEEKEVLFNQLVIAAMAKYRWISISPSYAPVTINPLPGNKGSVVFETEMSIDERKKLEDDLQQLTAQTLELAMIDPITDMHRQQISSLLSTVYNSLQTVERHSARQPELVKLANSYSDLNMKLSHLLQKMPPGGGAIGGSSDKMKHILKLAICAVAAVVLVCSGWFLFHGETGNDYVDKLNPGDSIYNDSIKKETIKKYEKIVAQAQKDLENEKYDKACAAYAGLCDDKDDSICGTFWKKLQTAIKDTYEKLSKDKKEKLYLAHITNIKYQDLFLEEVRNEITDVPTTKNPSQPSQSILTPVFTLKEGQNAPISLASGSTTEIENSVKYLLTVNTDGGIFSKGNAGNQVAVRNKECDIVGGSDGNTFTITFTKNDKTYKFTFKVIPKKKKYQTTAE